MTKVGTLVALCCGIFFVLTLTALVVSPKLTVPNLPDLAIKTRHTPGDGFSRLNMLYLKGSRQRTETLVERPFRADAINLTVTTGGKARIICALIDICYNPANARGGAYEEFSSSAFHPVATKYWFCSKNYNFISSW